MGKKLSSFKKVYLNPRILAAALLATGLVACQGKGSLFNFKAYKERATEMPAPSEMNIEKSFFKDPARKVSKRFLCGWAPELAVGELGEQVFGHLEHGSPHCNLVWDIRENMLVGLLVNPTFPEDTEANRARWKEYVEIPIVSHFYYERAKDGNGRETNEYIENSSRSDYRARPMMKLDLAGIRFRDPGLFWSARLNDRLTHSTVSDVEWDKKSGFLGFTLNARVSGALGYASGDALAQAKLRVNFLRFETDSTFTKTPYHPENSRHLNILHVMGRKHDDQPELYAAHWDFRKPVKLYINGAQDQDIANLLVSAVEKWNKVFAEEGVVPAGQKAFEPVVTTLKHAFDLRYPTINWVPDRRISMNSALGIGQAHADVTTGKILWGSVTLFGGILERLINDYSSSETNGSASAMNLGERKFPGDKKVMRIPEKLAFPSALADFSQTNAGFLREKIATDGRAFLEHEVKRLAESKPGARGANVNDVILSKIEALKSQMSAIASPQVVAKMANDIVTETRKLKASAEENFAQKSFLEMAGFTPDDKSKSPLDRLNPEDRHDFQAILKSGAGERLNKLRRFIPGAVAQFPDQELTGDAIRASMARSEAHGRRSFRDMYEGVVMKLALHEIGHMLGMGHNFKENILPEEGTVPQKMFEHLKARATREMGFTNISTVMGYLSGRTWLLLDGKEFSPGFNDRLVLRYLYRGEFPVFNADADKFEFAPVPKGHGRIPDFAQVGGKQLPARFFPSCNDIEASYNADPFCNRWDRGSTATELITTYFEDLSDNLVRDLYSMVGGIRGDGDFAEWRLWYRSFDTMARVRLFYDELRLRLATDKDLNPIWAKILVDEESLYEFSTACQADKIDSVQSSHLRELFFEKGGKSRQIKELCRSTAIALNEMRFLLTLPEADHTRIDHKERFIMGGYLVGDVEASQAQIFGKWYQLTNLPLKVSSLFTLTAPNSFLDFGWANPFYTFESHAPLYRSLFPREYTRLVADMVKSNLRYKALGDSDRTNLGHTILFSSWLLPRQDYLSKDSGLLPTDYERVLRNQTEFQFSVAAVLLTANKSQADTKAKPNHYKRFTGTMYDFMLDKTRSAREVYILPKGTVLTRVNDTFLYPITQLRFIDDTQAYYIALKIEYDYEVGDRLLEESVKFALNEQHERVNQICVEGVDGSGLNSYFTSEDFEGFYIPPGIAQETSKEKTTQFFESIETEFKKYETKTQVKMVGPYKGKQMRQLCNEAIRGVGQITATAGLLNGHWLGILPAFLK